MSFNLQIFPIQTLGGTWVPLDTSLYKNFGDKMPKALEIDSHFVENTPTYGMNFSKTTHKQQIRKFADLMGPKFNHEIKYIRTD